MLAVEEVSQGLTPLLIAERRGPHTRGFSRIIIDSREAQPEDLFVALRGERHDGHDFVAEAIARGATGAIVSRLMPALPEGVTLFHVSDTLAALQRLAAYRRAQHDVRVIGVSGSVGKTTCKELIAAVLGRRYRLLKSEANLNTEIGIPLTLLALTGEHQRVVLELAMYAQREIALLCDIAKPHIGVVTNIGPIHLERLGWMGAIVAAKAELVEALPADGIAVLNGDDPRVAGLASRTKARVLLYGTSQQCQVRGSDLISRGLDGISFRLTYGEAAVPVTTPLPGRHHLHHALAAAAVGLSEGLTLAEVAAALAEARPPLRLQPLAGLKGCTILDDTYNASPPSMLAALDLLAELPGRRLALLGDMRELGSYQEEGHRQVGRQAACTTDVLFLIGEQAGVMAEAARAAGHRQVRVVDSKEEAASLLKAELKGGDYLLVKASRALALETVIDALRAP